MAAKFTEGLPFESRTFQFTFKLNNAVVEPTEIHFHIGVQDDLGKKYTVETGTKDDMDAVSLGIYRYTFFPETYGYHYIRVWTSGDQTTKDVEYVFYVAQPSVPEDSPAYAA